MKIFEINYYERNASEVLVYKSPTDFISSLHLEEVTINLFLMFLRSNVLFISFYAKDRRFLI